MHDLEILIPIAFFAMIFLIIKTVTENRTRRLLVEKGMVDEKVKHLFARSVRDNPLTSLKWGMVLIGIGLALAIGEMFPRTFSESAVMGLMILFAGISFIVYYVLAKKQQTE
jgi:hypothetical protein